MRLTELTIEPMTQRQVMEFPYKRSTGPVVGRFLAALRDQRQIWGQRVLGGAVVVPPQGYSEWDGSAATEWVPVADEGTVVAVARVWEPIERLHPFTEPFAYILVRLDGADTALLHVAKSDQEHIRIGSRVRAEWAPDGERKGSIWDIREFRLVRPT
ncbi:MAG: OB-fold domain-containing protein [Candidatus Binatia bacterium]|nr:OB-fold domain-containing protein [Candidatus Binatia bacterium]